MTLARSLKCHLRVLEVHGVTLRVVRLRPQTTARFATNYFHDTWHIVSGSHGAVILGQLLWGLAFQQQPGTLVLVDGEHLVPTPFEGDRSDPILLVPDGLTSVDDDLLRALAIRLRRAPGPPRTIRWHCFGMPAALAASRDTDRARHWTENRAVVSRERMSRRGGFICYTAPAPILRSSGLGIHRMQHHGEGYYPLADGHRRWRYTYDGEFQIIPAFDDQVSSAIVARREVVGDTPRKLADEAPRWDDDTRWSIYHRQERALARLVRARR